MFPCLISGTDPTEWTGDVNDDCNEPFPWLPCRRRREGEVREEEVREGGMEEEGVRG